MLALALPLSATCGAVEAIAADTSQSAPAGAALDNLQVQPSAASGQADPAGAPVRAARSRVRRAPGHGIDDTVRRLARGLGLDEAQQKKLRDVLWDEQKQVWRLRQNPGAGVDWASAAATIVEQTRTRIRALLNDEQKQKYAVDVPRDQTAPAQADVAHWIQLQDSKRAQESGASK